jgi:Leucine-rich repeat (LRR) protein
MKKSFLFLALAWLIINGSMAQTGSVGDSLSTVFFKINYPHSTRSMDQLFVDTSFTYKNLTVYNFSAPSGFVMLRNQPDGYDVVGYSFDQEFSFDCDTSGLLISLADALAGDAPGIGYAPAKIPLSLKSGFDPVEPLVQTKWNQGFPYNYFCPEDPSVEGLYKKTLVGCVAVAMAQIIRYYDKWNDFAIYHTYTHASYGSLTCNAGGYNWPAMENKCYDVNNEVAKLLYDCGVLVNMNYGLSGSGAVSADAATRFAQMYRNGLFDSDLTKQSNFYTNISEYHPIYTTYPGHAFVCDGFDGNSFFHFNFGWGGSSNGFFPLTTVLGKSLTSAIYNTFPIRANNPPRKLKKSAVSGATIQISWTGPDQDRSGLNGYKIYLDDQYLADCQDTVFEHDCVAGSHYLKVSANFSSGESNWIGPATYYYAGNPVTIADRDLRYAMNSQIGIASAQRYTYNPTEGELRGITQLSVTNGADLSGIGQCINLRVLTLTSTTSSRTIDLEPLSECRLLSTLRIYKYQLINPQSIGSLSNLRELRLTNNQITDPEFLKSATSVTYLDLSGNSLSGVGFLNDMQRVEQLVMQNCNLTSFDALENTYGIKSVDVSNNHLTSLNWINENKTLELLFANNNEFAGSMALTGLAAVREINLSNNFLSEFTLSGSPLVSLLNLTNNQLVDITPILSENPNLPTLKAGTNKISILPAVSNKLDRLELQKNFINDLAPIANYGALTYIDLSDNPIVDLSGLVDKDYFKRLTNIYLRNIPISKESFLEDKPKVVASGITSVLPTQFHPGSPCYLNPGEDISMLNTLVTLTWEGDYNSEGYTTSVYLGNLNGTFEEIATGLSTKTLAYQLPATGNFAWYVVSKKDSLYLKSGVTSFKVLKGFSIPYIEDFEAYTAYKSLCVQTPFWKIFGTDQNSAKDAYVNTSRVFEGNQSLKITGITDVIFPITEYVAGAGQTEFMMLVDKDRQAFVQVVMANNDAYSLHYYKVGILEIYKGKTLVNSLNYKVREWIKVEVSLNSSGDFKIILDGQNGLQEKLTSPVAAVAGIRFSTLDGPGYYASAPTVFYLDSFAIKNGTPLSADQVGLSADFPAKVWVHNGKISLQEVASTIRNIRIISLDGRLLLNQPFTEEPYGSYEFEISENEQLFILILTDRKGAVYTRKMVAVH